MIKPIEEVLAQRKKVISLRIKGLSYGQIGLLLNISRQRVEQIIIASGRNDLRGRKK